METQDLPEQNETQATESTQPVQTEVVAQPVQESQSKKGPDFGYTLTTALKRPWRYRSLWFFGVLLAIFGGGSSFNSSSFQNNGAPNPAQFTKVWNSLPVATWVAIFSVAAVVLVVFIIIGLIVGSWALAAVINGNVKLENGEEITRKEIGKTGKTPVWGLIKLNFFIPLAVVLVLTAIASLVIVPLIFLGQTGAIIGTILGVVALLALIPFLIYFGLVWIMAARFVVVDGQKAWQSIGSARSLLKGSWWLTFALSIVNGFISGCGGCLGSILFVMFMVATVGFAIAKLFVVAWIMGVLALAGLVVLLIVAGYFRAFQESAMTIWWLGLKNKE